MKKQQIASISRGIIASIILVFIISLSTGCASFQKNNLAPVANFPTAEQKKTISVALSYAIDVNGRAVVAPAVDAGKKELTTKCVDRLSKSGLFNSVSENDPQADLALNVNIKNDGKANFVMAGLTGATFYIIPSSATEIYKLSATLTDTKSNRVAEIKLEDGFTQWQQILLLPLLPFKSTVAEVGACQNKLFDNLALEIAKADMLK